jgi:DNA-3-methyladenine glycosylase I
MPELFLAPDGRPRCHWCAATDNYLAYHDREWGFPVAPSMCD